MLEHIGHLINGEIHTDNSQAQAIFNPATGEPCAQVSMASKETVAMAISAAKQAYPTWRNTPPAVRAQVMYRFKQLRKRLSCLDWSMVHAALTSQYQNKTE